MSGRDSQKKSSGWSLLRLTSFGTLAVVIGYSIFNYQTLSHSEGWGLVGMVGFFAMGLAGLFLDFLILSITKNRQIGNALGLALLFILIWCIISLWLD